MPLYMEGLTALPPAPAAPCRPTVTPAVVPGSDCPPLTLAAAGSCLGGGTMAAALDALLAHDIAAGFGGVDGATDTAPGAPPGGGSPGPRSDGKSVSLSDFVGGVAGGVAGGGNWAGGFGEVGDAGGELASVGRPPLPAAPSATEVAAGNRQRRRAAWAVAVWAEALQNQQVPLMGMLA